MNGIHGYNSSKTSTNKLFVAYGNDVVDLQSNTGYGLNLNGNKVEFDTFVDRVFLQNYDRTPVTYNPTSNSWSTEYVERTMISKYIQKYNSRLYLGNCKFPQDGPLDHENNPIVFPSRIYHSDLFQGGGLTWGIEWGRNGRITQNSRMFSLVNPVVQDFRLSGIKIGDPLFITRSNSNDPVLRKKPFLVARVEEKALYFTEDVPISDTNVHFWVGSNWFDVNTDDDDQITGLARNATQLLPFKNDSLWFYNLTQLRQVNDYPGTSSNRSIINKDGHTYYFRGGSVDDAAIYRYDGVSAVNITRGIDPYLQGIDPDMYEHVVSWLEGDEVRFYVGDIINSNYNINMENAVITFHVPSGSLDVSPIKDVVTCSTRWRDQNMRKTYCGTDGAKVLEMNTGNSFRGFSIPFAVETPVYYPSGSDVINEFCRLQIIGRNLKGLKVGYKLWNNPSKVDDMYSGIGQCDDDLTELNIPSGHTNASGISLDFSEIGKMENDSVIEKITIFYKPMMVRRYESNR